MIYYYAGRSADGRRLQGSIEAASREVAASHLRARNVFVTTLETAGTIGGAWTFLRLCARSGGARPVFFRSFGALVAAGVPVRRALDTMMRQSGGGAFAETLASVAAEVEEGATLSAALATHPRDFSPVAIATVKAGELCGSLDEALRTLAELEDRDRALRKRVGAALAYPTVVAAASIGLVLFLVANTMPAFAAMFSEMHAPLPLGTQLLIAAASMLKNRGIWVVAGAPLFLATVALRRYKDSDAPWAAALDRVRLRTPVLGALVVKSTAARFARTLGSLLRSGVDIVGAIEASTGVVEGFVHRHGLRSVVESLRRGDTLVFSLEASGLFDATFLQLLQAGEESGTVDDMLFRVARYYELDVETALGSLTSILEPLLICALGAAIGTIVASIIIPLYSMIGNIQ
jgi:type IV pilus assembly protein PilC